MKVYCYSGEIPASPSQNCSSASIWSPTPAVYFEATLKASSGATAYAQLSPAGLEVSTSSTNYTRLRSGQSTLTAQDYTAQLKANGGTAYVTNAAIILDQSTVDGITALETIQHYITKRRDNPPVSYTRYYYDNLYVSTNFTGIVTTALELTGRNTGSASSYAKACTTSETGCSAELVVPGGLGRKRSASFTPTSGQNYDAWIKCDQAGSQCSGKSLGEFNNVWLIIQISSLPFPEAAIFALPGMVFLPRIVKWVKERRLRRKKKVAGSKPPPTRMIANVKRIIANERIVPLIKKRLSYGRR